MDWTAEEDRLDALENAASGCGAGWYAVALGIAVAIGVSVYWVFVIVMKVLG